MVMEADKALRGIIRGLPEGDPQHEFLLLHSRAIEARALLACLDFDEFPTTEAEVQAELARQADQYLKFGLNKHPKVEMTGGEFKDSLIVLAKPLPEKFAGRFGIPVAVLGQVPPKEVYEAAGVAYYLEGLDVGDWPDDPQGYTTPRGLYLVWMDTGVGNLDKKVEDVRANLPAYTRGATEADGSGLYVAHPRILEHHMIDLPGTSVGSGSAPDLSLFDGRPGLDHGWVGFADPRWGSALCGRD